MAPRKLRQLIVRAVPLGVVLVAWEVASRYLVANPALFPAPTRVASAFLPWASSGELARDVVSSWLRLVIGFLGGAVVGIAVGLATGRSARADSALSPVLQVLRPLPPVAIIPLVIVWFGIGDGAKVFATSFAVFFPTWINTHLGAARIPTEYLWSARLLSHSRLRTVLNVLLPATAPAIISGLRTAIAIAFVMVYVNELAGASSGLGYQISVSHLAYRIDRMMAALAVLGAAGALTDGLFSAFVRIALPWMKANSR